LLSSALISSSTHRTKKKKWEEAKVSSCYYLCYGLKKQNWLCSFCYPVLLPSRLRKLCTNVCFIIYKNLCLQFSKKNLCLQYSWRQHSFYSVDLLILYFCCSEANTMLKL
jgi:hypothetical protein